MVEPAAGNTFLFNLVSHCKCGAAAVSCNWRVLFYRITLGNQLDGVRLLDPEVTARFKKRYPDGNVLKPPTTKT